MTINPIMMIHSLNQTIAETQAKIDETELRIREQFSSLGRIIGVVVATALQNRAIQRFMPNTVEALLPGFKICIVWSFSASAASAALGKVESRIFSVSKYRDSNVTRKIWTVARFAMEYVGASCLTYLVVNRFSQISFKATLYLSARMALMLPFALLGGRAALALYDFYNRKN